MTTDELSARIDGACSELEKAAHAISRLEGPVSHLIRENLRFHGGMIGTIQDYMEARQLVRLMNTPIYGSLTFYELAFHITKTAQELAGWQVELQKNSAPTDSGYYGNVEKIVSAVTDAVKAWYRYAPDLANAPIIIGGKSGVSLRLTVDEETRRALRRMDLPGGMKVVPCIPYVHTPRRHSRISGWY